MTLPNLPVMALLLNSDPISKLQTTGLQENANHLSLDKEQKGTIFFTMK